MVIITMKYVFKCDSFHTFGEVEIFENLKLYSGFSKGAEMNINLFFIMCDELIALNT